MITVNRPLRSNCKVMLDNKADSFSEFVVVGDTNGITTMVMNADAITLGRASKMVSSAFIEAYSKLSADEKLAVDDILKQ